MKKIILDVDTGIDDSLAIAYAVHSPELDILGVTTCFGNVSVEEATRNTLVVLEKLDSTALVIPGAGKPLFRGPTKGSTVEVHGEDGLGGVLESEPTRQAERGHAARFMREQARKHPKQVRIVTVGPLTNLAMAIMQDPEFAGLVDNVIVMGGAVTVPGNVTPHAEANIFADPEAAEYVFRSGIPITLVGLDVTMQTLLPLTEVRAWRNSGTQLADFLAGMTEFYIGAYQQMYPGIEGCALHDPLAVGVAIDPSFVSAVPMHVQVDVEGILSYARTVGDLRSKPAAEPNVKVCIGVDAERFRKHFLSRVLGVGAQMRTV
ncbi:nucleoside hydrolase [Paenibacillus methanolicus]|uniref:Purine nucleosidase n=1 Tax=Paenibacillus methanolicus TaxID=582686 RepID=A0A5S5C0J4_9BACL|nr:nucleoside hydrolase [Paenibacillus methanolicus]TYP71976.1 purine nucleosidase [Paenibacillus methanolicus]